MLICCPHQHWYDYLVGWHRLYDGGNATDHFDVIGILQKIKLLRTPPSPLKQIRLYRYATLKFPNQLG